MIVVIILILRSLLMFVGRSASIKWIKITSSPETQQNRIKYYFLTFFISTAVSGLFATLFLQKLNIWQVAIVDSVSFVLAIITFSFLRYQVREQDRSAGMSLSMNTSLKTLAEILRMSSIRNSLYWFVCASHFFRAPTRLTFHLFP